MPKRILVAAILFSLSAPCFSQEPRADVSGDFLLKTSWGGSAPFNTFAPGGNPTGCHSNALAQVFFFHRLAPHGETSYECTDGTPISEDFTAYAPQWDQLALDKESGNDDEDAARATARFIYSIASIVRKDFGTDQYVDYPGDHHKAAVESHFHCALTSYVNKVDSTIDNALKTPTDLYALLKAEIDSDRPAGLYYLREPSGHAVVIDGYTLKEGKTYFHANFGWLGGSDGWYLLEEDLPRNTTEIVLITLVPEGDKRAKKGE